MVSLDYHHHKQVSLLFFAVEVMSKVQCYVMDGVESLSSSVVDARKEVLMSKSCIKFCFLTKNNSYFQLFFYTHTHLTHL